MRRVEICALVLFIASSAGARPGGGQSFSGGSRSSSFGGSSSGRSSGGSSWGSGRSSSNSYSYSPTTTTTYGNTPSVATTTTYDSANLQGQIDQGDCMLECVHPTIMSEDGGTYDTNGCEHACILRKQSARAAAPTTTEDAPRYAPDPPLSGGAPLITFSFVFFGAIAAMGYNLRRRKEREWATSSKSVTTVEPSVEALRRKTSIDEALASLGVTNKAFSRVLFEDFLYALYAEAHAARGGAKLDRMGPYLGERARAALERWPADVVDGIIVGSASLRDVRADTSKRVVRAVIAFEANYTERRGSAEEKSFYAREEWTLERKADAPSRSPEHARVIGCANCGAPIGKVVGGACTHCGVATSGAIDWRVVDIDCESREPRGPILTGTTEEVGTNDPTLVAPDVKQRWAELSARDPEVTWSKFDARARFVFATFHRTWAARDLAEMRALASDMLFETQRYWIAAYEAQRLHNITDDATVVTMQLSKITSDAYFDAVTVRVFASCKDYTLDASGKVVGGSRERERQYSEYWTFIRSTKKTGAPKTTTDCPNCGAPFARIGMSGECASCGVKVTTGDFDWILSRIEQDEVYAL